MSISAATFKREQAGKTKFSHHIGEHRPIHSEAAREHCRRRGFSDEVIERFGILETVVSRYEKQGWREIPVFFDLPALVFPISTGALKVWLFSLPKDEGRWICTPIGFGAGFFGDLESKEIVITEGEPDCALLLSKGISACTTSAGAGTFDAKMAERFRGKKVYVCYDADRKGIQGAGRAGKLLSRVAETYLIDLPLPGTPEMKDVSDFFLKKGGTLEQFRSICRTARAA